jgi:hypothetical protein
MNVNILIIKIPTWIPLATKLIKHSVLRDLIKEFAPKLQAKPTLCKRKFQLWVRSQVIFNRLLESTMLVHCIIVSFHYFQVLDKHLKNTNLELFFF